MAYEEILSWDTDDLMNEAVLIACLKTGVLLEVNDALVRFRKLIPNSGFEPEVEDLVDQAVEIFGYSALGTVVTPVEDISIANIMDDKKWQEIGVARILDWATTMHLARRKVDLNNIFPDGYHFAQRYPQLTMSYIHDASFAIDSAFSLIHENIDKVGRISGLEIAQRGMARFARRFKDIQNAFNRILFTPDSINYSEFTDVISRYLVGSREGAVLVLYKLGLNKGESVTSAYRKARKLAMIGENVEFYELFCNSTNSVVEEGRLSELIYVPTQDDLAGILDNEKEIVVSEPESFQIMGGRISSIFSKAHFSEYTVDLNKVNWANLIPPSEVIIRFQSRPHKFSIDLAWENDNGEFLNVNLVFDTKDHKLDWNFLEDPEDQVMNSMRASVLMMAQSILNAMEAEVNSQIESKKRGKLEALVPSTLTRGKRVRTSDESYHLRKVIKQEARQAKTEDFQVDSFETAEIKRTITVPEPNRLNALLAVLGIVDAGIVRAALDDYNMRGVGKFTRKRSLDGNGEPLYTLAVGCTTPKGVRVLVKEASSTSGQRTFEIIDIRYRKDIYRKAKI